MDILDYQLILEKGDIRKLSGDLDEHFEKLQLELPSKDSYGGFISFFENMELEYSIREFNNRKCSLVINYALAKKYLDKGIPDAPYYKVPGKNGTGISYFPLFEDEHYVNHYWYGFYMESFYFRFEGLLDAIYHILKQKYDLNIPTKNGFQQAVLKKVKIKEPDLYNFLKSFKENNAYIDMKKIRNDITHNYSPNQLSSGITRHKNGDGKTEAISSGVPEYTNVSQIQSNVDSNIRLLAELIEDIQKYL